LSPAHLKAARLSNGDLAVSWIRRSRVDADSWLGSDIPLGEETEAYQVDIAPAGGGVIRSVTVAAPSWTYAADAITEDFPALPESIGITVRQISAVVGQGTPASTMFALG
jgi:hypothetical protein